MPTSVLHAAFDNHISFLAKHRGELHTDSEGLWIVSEAEGFTTWTPREGARSLPLACTAVRLAPWCGADRERRLADADFRPAETLCYMQLTEPARAIPVESAAQVAIVSSEGAARAFAAAQAEGFELGNASGDRWWAALFEAVALRNWRDPAQTFFLARINGEAAGSTLAVRTAGVTGIYAVATRPAFRRQGVSASLLERARQEAMQDAKQSIILQANRGSYAEKYYRKLGFETLRELTVWRR